MLGFHEAHKRRGIRYDPACEICIDERVHADEVIKSPDTANHFPAWVLAKRRRIRARKKEMAAA